MALLIALGALGLSCATSVREKWGPFRAQVMDMETGQPIAGAVALALWWEIVPTPIQGNSRFYDAKEAVTGSDGRFEIHRLSEPLWRLGAQPGEIIIFAKGYEWRATLVTPPGGQEFVHPTVVQMQRLKTPEEERKYLRRLLPAGVPHERMRQFIRALNEERAALGMGTYSTGEEQ